MVYTNKNGEFSLDERERKGCVGVDRHLRRSQGRRLDKLELGVAHELSGEPQERLLEVVVRLGRDVEVLQVLLSVEGDGLGLDLSLLDVDFVTAQDNRDVLTHSDKVSVPVWNVLVRDSRGDVEHDDTTLTVDVVTVSQSAEFLLSGRVPDVESDLTEVGVE
ncbi:hypothetical protein OGATHE_000017 [Ogataea polymorpha]|uniref:Uncharacterized protein n=1 Tax=Ogataea polymorpha TaxID=460523 RepID=A0A9P8PWX0_9ASCO|nr:hypothetical protein OGATHE_000017 [Ogataea polymorpha]